MKNYLFRQLYQSLFYPALFVILCWISFAFQESGHRNLTHLGVLPREAAGLPGIVTSVFIHGDLGHIASNSIPLLVLGGMLFYFYKRIAKPVSIWLWLISGLWLWIGGRNNTEFPTYHIGASTLIYALATFLFFSGIFRRHLQLMAASAIVVFLYGGIMWGVFPVKAEISWEGHLFGAIAGVLVAFNYRSEGPQKKKYEWEDEKDEDEPEPTEPEQPAQDANHQVTITYIYKSSSEKEGGQSPNL